ncbi:MAG: hypothetical protein EXS05_04790 [Planctomycetaceae bacterium]|nr:hypothetical protein [Planctomycetaceae bacterium]
MRTERELLIDVLDRLNQAGVSYMLTGSMASNYWGTPRTTHDLDFVLAMQPAQVEAIVAAFEKGFFIQSQSVRQVFRPPNQFNVIDEQSALKADFWLLRDNEFEQTAFERRLPVTLFGVPASIATAEDIILHKLHWHRITPSERQLTDAAGVVDVQAGRLDTAYLKTWGAALHVEHELQDLLEGKIRPKTT